MKRFAAALVMIALATFSCHHFDKSDKDGHSKEPDHAGLEKDRLKKDFRGKVTITKSKLKSNQALPDAAIAWVYGGMTGNDPTDNELTVRLGVRSRDSVSVNSVSFEFDSFKLSDAGKHPELDHRYPGNTDGTAYAGSWIEFTKYSDKQYGEIEFKFRIVSLDMDVEGAAVTYLCNRGHGNDCSPEWSE